MLVGLSLRNACRAQFAFGKLRAMCDAAAKVRQEISYDAQSSGPTPALHSFAYRSACFAAGSLQQRA